jgi:serine/threonine protein kinase
MNMEGGTIVQHFVLERYLGGGGMGAVWQARDLRNGRLAALKILHSPGDLDPAHRIRLLREAYATRLVIHPAIVPVEDVIEHEGAPVLVMELLTGETLREHLARLQRLPLPRIAEILLPIADALGAAHRAGVVHRDLKPENIFIQTDDPASTSGRESVRLLDFGLARFFEPPPDSDAILTGLDEVIGTVEYMAPEQALRPREADHRVDVWALGVILYEALSGCRPIEGDSNQETLRQLLLDAVTPIEVLVPHLPFAAAELVNQSLSKNPERRPRDVGAVAEALKSFTHGACGAAARPGPADA